MGGNRSLPFFMRISTYIHTAKARGYSLACALFLFALPVVAGAQPAPGNVAGCAGFCLQNPLKFQTICGLIKGVFNAILTLGAPLAVLAFIYAGFQLVLAQGNTTKLAKAKDNLLYIFIGVALFLGAWVLGQIIASTLNTVTGGQTGTTASCN